MKRAKIISPHGMNYALTKTEMQHMPRWSKYTHTLLIWVGRRLFFSIKMKFDVKQIDRDFENVNEFSLFIRAGQHLCDEAGTHQKYWFTETKMFQGNILFLRKFQWITDQVLKETSLPPWFLSETFLFPTNKPGGLLGMPRLPRSLIWGCAMIQAGTGPWTLGFLIVMETLGFLVIAGACFLPLKKSPKALRWTLAWGLTGSLCSSYESQLQSLRSHLSQSF